MTYLHSKDLISLNEIESEAVHWLLPGFIAYGKITVLEGYPDRGKSTLTLDLAARITTGTPMPDGTAVESGNVIILTSEDSAADTVRPRLLAAGGNPSRVFMAGDVLTGQQPLKLPDDTLRLVELVRQYQARLLVVDPFSAYLSDDVDSRNEQDMRRTLSPLSLMAQKLNAAIVLLRHFTKDRNAPAILRGGGSMGIGATARSVIAVVDHPEHDDRRVLTSVKQNLGLRPRPWEFSFESVGEVGRIVWLGQADLDTEILSGESPDERAASKDVKEVLLEILSMGPLPPLVVQELVKEAGVFVSDRTLRRASKEHLLRARLGFGPNAIYLWYLPKHSEHIAQLKQAAKIAGPQAVASFLLKGGAQG
jgi:hypothetical protein